MKINERLNKLRKRRDFLKNKKENTENELKDITSKIKKQEEIIKERDIKETVLTAEKAGLKFTDLKKIIKKNNIEEIKQLLKDD